MEQRVKFITNRELLAEIHKSKNSFCHYDKPEYADYDIIVNNVEEITPEIIEEARANRAKKLSTKTAPVLADSIDVDSLVYRVNSWAHVPLDPTGKRRPRAPGEDSLMRVNFPPFIHVVLENGVPTEVGRSHWDDGLCQGGAFSIEHGRISRRLAEMFMLLVDRYSRRGNWRGYCTDTLTEALTQRGWLKHDKITTDDTILSFDGKQLAWSSIKSIFRDHYTGPMFHLTVTGMDALVTPGHKFVTQDGLKRAEMLLAKDKIIMSGDAVAAPEVETYENAFVELVGWTVTEGCIYSDPVRTYKRIGVYQNVGAKADRIRECLTKLGERFSETVRPNGNNNSIRFDLTKNVSEQVLSVIEEEDKVPKMSFMLALTYDQRELLMHTMISGDGHRSAHVGYSQKSAKHMDAFVALATMLGHRTRVSLRDIVSYGKPTQIHSCVIYKDRVKHSNVDNIDFHGGKRRGSGLSKMDHQNVPTVDYDGIVWCPETEYGSFMARNNGTVYLTGNTYVDEMRSHALMQLSQTALQFDEKKSANPFAFFTTICRHCFTRVLNIEKRVQSTRDDLLIMAGVNPSFTRQVEHEMAERCAERSDERVLEGSKPSSKSSAPPKKARGRKPKVVTEV